MYFLFFFLFMLSFLFLFMLSFLFLQDMSLMVDFIIPVSFLMDCSFSFLFDFVSVIFFFSVSLIASVVFLYSKFYMPCFSSYQDFLLSRFYFLLYLFVLSMFMLVFSGSWFIVMLGWDGLGLVSFLLVIYYNDSNSLGSGLLTVFMNRIGDCFFIISFMFFFSCGWAYIESFVQTSFLLPLLLVFFGLSTKSAQIPFSSWLPAAMAAPTPVSSLVHSSTLVTAGVYVFIRFNYLMENLFSLIMVVSLFTMVLAGSFALYELDFKKLVAMSTLSQLGFMVFSVSMGWWMMSMFHMMFHAFFKSILFLSTGNLMHYIYGGQDSRLFGALGGSFFSKVFFSISCLSLMGFPFTMGFYSKDFLLGLSFSLDSCAFYYIFLFGCSCTVAYSLRLLLMGFSMFPSFFSSFSFQEENTFFFPLSVLYLGCVYLGYLFYFFSPFIFLSFSDSFVGVMVMALGGLLLSVYSSYFKLSFFMNMGYLFNLSTSSLSSLMNKFIYSLDYTWSEVLGGAGVFSLMSAFSFYKSSFLNLNFLPIFLVFIFFILY